MPDPASGPTLLRRLLSRMEFDWAVAYSVAVRVWQLAAGPVSLVLIAIYFSPQEQGFYYAFSSLMALQAFLELGLNVVVLNLASGQWAKLRLGERGRVQGDPAAMARLGDLLRRLMRWYTGVAALFVFGVGGAGYLFLAAKQDPGTAWQLPWWALVVVTAGLTWTWPLVALLEGCDQVVTVTRYRLQQAVLGNIAVWGIMVGGGGLWAAAASAGVRLACDAHLLGYTFRPLLGSLAAAPRHAQLDWRRDVWPLQWRQGLIVPFQYFELQLIVLVVFYYHGSVLGGQTGMTWTLAMTLHAAALAWVQTRAPRFGALIARGEVAELNLLFRRVTLIAMAAAAAGLLAFSAAIYGIIALDVHLWGRRLADRVLPLPIVVLYLSIMALKVPPYCMAFYIRAHRQEPLVPLSIASSVASGLLVWQGGWHFGPLGAGLGLLATTLLINVPGHYFIWRKFRYARAGDRR